MRGRTQDEFERRVHAPRSEKLGFLGYDGCHHGFIVVHFEPETLLVSGTMKGATRQVPLAIRLNGLYSPIPDKTLTRGTLDRGGTQRSLG